MQSETEQIDPKTGEVIETLAADGRQRYPKVTTLTDLIHMLGDGEFNQICAEKIKDFSTELEARGCDEGKKVKGKVSLSIDVERDPDGVYFFTPQIAFKLPTEKHPRTIGWVTADNEFTPNKPNQGNLFGTMRDVTGTARTVR